MKILVLNCECGECSKVLDMIINSARITKKERVRLNLICPVCDSKYTMTRRKGILKKIKEVGSWLGKKDIERYFGKVTV